MIALYVPARVRDPVPSLRLPYPLLGHAGFLQFFDVQFRGAASEVLITPNSSFPGRHF